MQYAKLILENQKKVTNSRRLYNPMTGEGSTSCNRIILELEDAPIKKMYLPDKMFDEPLVKNLIKYGSIRAMMVYMKIDLTKKNKKLVWDEFCKVRNKYDFEYWAFQNVKIKDKNSDKDISFILNRGQQKLLKEIYAKWYEGKPIRIILCKARQWGGSTLVQIFMSYIQLVHRKQWHSVIAAHIENTAKIIRGMFTKVIKSYNPTLIGAKVPIKLVPFEQSLKTRTISERGCRITIGSAEKPEGLRGEDTAMAHLSEVALWPSSKEKKPEDLVQSIISGIGKLPDSMIVFESTAKGVGNFFHREWLRAKRGESGFRPVFVSWFEIDSYSSPIYSYKEFIDTMTPKEFEMFEAGATFEGIAWYREKKSEYPDEWRFISEFPSNDIEAFQSTGQRFYPIDDIYKLRRGNRAPIAIGDVYGNEPHGANALDNVGFRLESNGMLKVWQHPDPLNTIAERYVVVVDVGGISDKADNSVITVFDRYWMTMNGSPEVIADWVGHIDHDLLAWKSAQIAKYYGNALLVIESNTLETAGTEGDHFEYILDEIAEYYDNLFSRTPSDKIREGVPPKWGFHTNKSSKQMVFDHQKKVVREDMYIEPSSEACDEHDTMEIKQDGSINSVEGCRDDRHMTRAIGNWVCWQYLSAPVDMKDNKRTTRKIHGEATF